ncbi:MAG: hypothetical protein ACOC0P_06240, partial [Planctomycetota bacterium]
MTHNADLLKAPQGILAVVHRRLAIIDPESGAQPLFHPPAAQLELRRHPSTECNGPGTSAQTPPHDVPSFIAFNGCLYNHRELRDTLVCDEDVSFAIDHSDTETLLAAWNAWGPDALTRFVGMFAFAIWDAQRGALVLARDRAGEKPLYFIEVPAHDDASPAAIIFGST